MRRPNLILTAFFILAGYAPFLGQRLIRTTGDEKVYVAQALEMADRGAWFVQTLSGEPDYYKGPLHLVLVHIGYLIFGNSLWAGLYMNLLLILVGGLTLALIIQEAFPKRPDWPLWGGLLFAFNAGVFGHLYASQMDVELTGTFALSFYFLWKSRALPSKNPMHLAFWITAGLASGFKSPLHSVLLVATALLFWCFEGTLSRRLKERTFYLHSIYGVSIGVSMFLPALLWDGKNFIDFYIFRENLEKSLNGGVWWQSVLPMLTYFLFPWTAAALLAYIEGLVAFKQWKQLKHSPTFQLGIAAILPSFLFFALYPFHQENYALPTTAGMVLILLSLFHLTSRWVVRKSILLLTSLSVFILPCALYALEHQIPLPKEWWPTWLTPLCITLSVASLLCTLKETFTRHADGLGLWASAGNWLFMMILSLILAVLGEMEVQPLKAQLQKDHARGVTYNVVYWNLNHLIWNEWGIMRLAAHTPIQALLNESQLVQSIQRGDLILARDISQKESIDQIAAQHFPSIRSEIYPWPRWRTQPYTHLKEAWKVKKIDGLFDHSLMVRYLPQ